MDAAILIAALLRVADSRAEAFATDNVLVVGADLLAEAAGATFSAVTDAALLLEPAPVRVHGRYVAEYLPRTHAFAVARLH